MPTDRTTRIANIIEKRQPLARRLEEVEANLKLLASALHNLEGHRDRLVLQVDDLEVRGRLKEINFTPIQSDIRDEISALGKLRSRFSRNTLNIGVVGRAGQGKSRLLQSLSGLSTDEIPSGDRSHCTGVRSTVHHNPDVETYGEVWFHSERSFLDEVITPYYEKLNLGSRPFTLENFAHNPLPPLPNQFSGKAEFGAMYEHLRRYHTNFDKYRDLLKQPSPYQISKHQIREYVAQDTPDCQRIYFNYLAVREAKIVCRFPREDVGQVALIDMPGLGDTGLGDAERLMAILGQDVDIVLFVRMPRPPRDFWADVDVKLYDTARAALIDLPIHLWSFMVLNQTSASSSIGDNSVYCEDLVNTRGTSHINVVECITASCVDVEEANKKVLDRVLDYLMMNITALDQQYAAACQDRLIHLHDAVAIELQKAKVALGQATQRDGSFPLFVKLFNKLWNDLTVGLEGLLRDLRWQRDVQDADFKAQVDAALQACRDDTGIPSLEEIKIRRDSEGSYNIAYNKYLHEVRAYLSQHFLSLDDGLKRSLDNIKSQVADVLIEQGNLGSLTGTRGTEFLKTIENVLPEDLTRLKLGFHILSTFELSYRGLIQHRIRRHLDRLTPDETPIQLSQNPSAQEILVSLQTLQAEAVYECGGALEEFLCEPSQAAYAIVEEFVDRILRAEGVKDDWQVFLQEIRSDIWANEFEILGEHSRLRREWLTSVDNAISANQPELIRFLP